MAETGIEGADGEALAVVLLLVDGLDGGSLDDEHGCWLLSVFGVGRSGGGPPTGGHGVNTGIGDAAGASWVLDAMVKGWGGPKLLSAYGAERRPVAEVAIWGRD